MEGKTNVRLWKETNGLFIACDWFVNPKKVFGTGLKNRNSPEVYKMKMQWHYPTKTFT